MAWLELKVITTRQHAELIGDYLNEVGALAITLCDGKDQPILEPGVGETPLWQDVHVIALFDAGIELEPVREQLLVQFDELNDISVKIDPLEDQDWTATWREHFEPMLFADRLWVHADWHEVNAREHQVKMLLNPGLAFGTGTHPTTAMCLNWLAGHLSPGSRVIDFGCGSGILAIAALKLGAHYVHCIDIDPQALEAMHYNAKQNELDPSCYQAVLPEQFIISDITSTGADVLVANILANPLIDLASQFASLVKAGGMLVLSGVLAEQAERVQAAYLDNFDLVELQQDDEWVCIIAQRKTH
ncbi:Ribosomal protein L11 methyltransferase [Piscirickettsia salmonis]|uniref:50S ribosomal protein L11 methyltransferase n=1 Tax=Piscirickettsia salmonis TaxID=1238 RepID=UPI0012BAD14B|nr:50S ribosomal protein L11 methyltransferase [Piscirickettsia salmonis]QGP56425.1 Ribosomal protein L11 methyltransferase [Piscirickettsia salmonis]QGP57710.1 Ribosomal protein L11 methyltransferase [Piscirickettsia salmonis]QGP65988.1 Ribosomal protein L11 methyltransferase [Piscirickettsia salmonis]